MPDRDGKTISQEDEDEDWSRKDENDDNSETYGVEEIFHRSRCVEVTELQVLRD